jgi:hypothetical protein
LLHAGKVQSRSFARSHNVQPSATFYFGHNDFCVDALQKQQRGHDERLEATTGAQHASLRNFEIDFVDVICVLFGLAQSKVVNIIGTPESDVSSAGQGAI